MSRHLCFILAAAMAVSAGAAVASDVKIPRDAASGLATGKRMHKPVVITKEWASEAEARKECDSLGGKLSTIGGKLACTAEERESPTLMRESPTVVRESPTLPSIKK